MTENEHWITKMFRETVESVNNMTWEEARAAEQRHGYGIKPGDNRSFWD